MIALIQSFNLVLGLLGAVLLLMIAVHLYKGFRFSVRQERQALTLLWFYILFVAAGHVLVGFIATQPALEESGTRLPALAGLYLITKVGVVSMKLLLILWVWFVFWPTQEGSPGKD